MYYLLCLQVVQSESDVTKHRNGYRVGFGVGIPFGLTLIVLLCLLLRQLRRYDQAAAGKTGQNNITQPVLETKYPGGGRSHI